MNTSLSPESGPRRSTFRKAFTLIELLVVIAIIAILIALLVPAVQKVREASNRTYCQNGLKQMGLAFHSHHDSHKAFPSGGRYWSEYQRVMSGGSPADFRTQSWGWAYQILPYIEQTALWQEPNDDVVGGTPVKMYICPSSRPATVFVYTQSGANTKRFMMDYSGNAGYLMYPDPTSSTNTFDGPIVPSQNIGPKKNRKLRHITDGTACTMLIGEKYLSKAQMNQQSSCSDDQGWVDGWDNDALASAVSYSYNSSQVTPPQRTGWSDLTTCGGLFGSIHPVMQCVFCDGSVHIINFSITPQNFANLLRINDEQSYDPTGIDS